MKNKIFTKFTWILALCATILSSTLYVACTKDVTIATEQSDSSILATSAKEAALAPTPKQLAESVAKTGYDHLKLYFTQKKAEDYVNPLIRKQTMEALAKVEADYKGLSFEQSLQKAEADKMIRPQMAQAMRELSTVTVAGNNDATIGELVARFKAFEEKIYADKALTDQEKMQVGGTSASLRSIIRYQNEIDKATILDGRANGNAQPRENCLLGRRLGCFANVFFKASIGAVVTGAITGGAITGPAFVAGIVVGIINIFIDNSCVCGNATSGGGCFDIQFLNPVINGSAPCDPAIGFVVSGPGTLPSQFNWTASFIDANGFERVIQDVNGKPTFGPSLLPFIVPDPNTEITLKVIPLGCQGKEFKFSLKGLLGDPGSVFISGPYSNSLNGTSTFTMSGSCLVNPYNQFSWNQPSVGNIVSGGNTTSANIQFNMKTCGNGFYSGCFPAYIIGHSTNPCFDQLQSGDAYSIRVY